MRRIRGITDIREGIRRKNAEEELHTLLCCSAVYICVYIHVQIYICVYILVLSFSLSVLFTCSHSLRESCFSLVLSFSLHSCHIVPREGANCEKDVHSDGTT